MRLKKQSGRKYLSDVKRRVKCSGKLRRGFLKVLSGELYNFELEHPDAGGSDYIAQFGAPETVAASYLSELSRRERAAYWLPLAAVLGVIFVSVFLLLSYFLIMQHSDQGYMVEEIASEVSRSDAASSPASWPTGKTVLIVHRRLQ